MTCAGFSRPAGTGPYIFDKKVTTNRTIGPNDISRSSLDTENEQVLEVHFTANPIYWDGAPGIDRIVVQAFADHEAVLNALLDGRLDMAYGSGTLAPDDYVTASQAEYASYLMSAQAPTRQTRLVVLNSGR